MNEGERAAGLAETPGYRYADHVGGELFVAGQVPRDADGQLVGAGDAAAQAEQCLQNLSTLLGVHGLERRHVRHLRVYVAGEHEHLLAAWSVVRRWFDDDAPPATLLGVAALGYKDQLVEIEPTVVAD
jgi:enamine deaminase RidA (YjgF/YER057c/UK114 family)